MPEDMSGKQIDDNVKLVEIIGTGGFGEVYRANHGHRGEVAVKFSMPERREILEREAEGLKPLQDCPNTVSVEYVNFEAEHPYIVMQFMKGGSLKDRLKKGALDYEEAVRIAIDVSKALQYAHEKKIIHRDVKPSNILFDKEGNANLSDFGLYKTVTEIVYGGSTIVNPLEGEIQNTQQEVKITKEKLSKLKNSMLSSLGLDGKIIGTLNYMAPEQEENGEVSQKSDIYSLGAVLFEMLTGKNVPSGRFDGPLDYNQNIPSDLNDIVNKMIASDKNKRYASAQQVITALEKVLNPQEAVSPEDKLRILEETPGGTSSTNELSMLTQELEQKRKKKEREEERLQEKKEKVEDEIIGHEGYLERLMDRLEGFKEKVEDILDETSYLSCCERVLMRYIDSSDGGMREIERGLRNLEREQESLENAETLSSVKDIASYVYKYYKGGEKIRNLFNKMIKAYNKEHFCERGEWAGAFHSHYY